MSKLDKVLGSVSPLYGAVSGEGLFGNIGNILQRGVVGAAMSEEGEEEKPGKVGAKPGAKKYSKGGVVSRGNGCANRVKKCKLR